MRQVFLLAVVALGACQRAPAGTPQAAFLAFSDALHEGDTAVAYEALSQATRTAIEGRAKAIAAASQGTIKEEPALMLFQAGVKPMPVGEVKVVQADDRSAELEVTVGGTQQRVKLVKDGQRWMINLADAFAK